MDTLNLPEDTDDKYVTFNRRELKRAFERKGLPFPNFLKMLEINDAVVIRRQDKFASPALATYASMISMVATNHSDPDVAKELLAIADYFEGQAQLAAAEGYKLPDR